MSEPPRGSPKEASVPRLMRRRSGSRKAEGPQTLIVARHAARIGPNVCCFHVPWGTRLAFLCPRRRVVMPVLNAAARKSLTAAVEVEGGDRD